MNEQFLGIYLRDHYAASAAGVALARRVLGRHHALSEEIAGDRITLATIMRQLDVQPSRMKVSAVRLAELLGRLKLNGRLLGHSPLSKVVELETLLVGIRGKEALWAALATADLRLEGIDLQVLAEAARLQAQEVERMRLAAAATTFDGSA